jgi:cytoskeletal protein CcmA (bactofilin family)
MWNKDEQGPPSTPAPQPGPNGSGRTRIGSSVALKGTVKADEDLILEGELNGSIKVAGHKVTVGRKGRVKADVSARVIEVEGSVVGDLTGSERVVVTANGTVEGNIKAPRVSLENGAQFKGSIDMDPASVETTAQPARKGPKAAEPTVQAVEQGPPGTGTRIAGP